MRAFIALELPGEFADGVAAAARTLGSVVGGRSVPRENYHLTLARHAQIPWEKLPELAFPRPARANRVTLFRSLLESDGAVYKPLFSTELADSAEWCAFETLDEREEKKVCSSRPETE